MAYENTHEENIFKEIEELLKPIIKKASYVEYGTNSISKGITNNVIQFTYKDVKVVLYTKM